MKRSSGVIQPMTVAVRNPVPFSPYMQLDDGSGVAILTWSASGPVLSPGATLSFACTGSDHAIEIWNMGRHVLEGRTPEVIVKKTQVLLSTYLLLTVVLVLLAVFYRISITPDRSRARLKPPFAYFSPPLRAPPLA